MDILAGPEPLYAPAWKLDLPQARHSSLSDYRVGVWFDDEDCPVDPELVGMFEAMASNLAQAGATVTRSKPAHHAEILNIYYFLLSSITGSSFPKHIYEMFANMDDDGVTG